MAGTQTSNANTPPSPTNNPAAGGNQVGVNYSSTTDFGTATNPNLDYTTLGNGNMNSLFTGTPQSMASAWGLPTTGAGLPTGGMNLPAGMSGTQPANPKDVTVGTRGLRQAQLYVALNSNAKISGDLLKAAQQMGGAIALAAENSGEKVATKSTRTKANQLLATGIQKNLGIDTSELLSTGKTGLGGKAPQKLVNVLQNAGYGVRTNMTLGQVLTAASTSPATSTIAGPQTMAQYIQSMTNGQFTTTDIKNLQSQLYAGGFYDPAYYSGAKSITQGNLTTATLLAFRSAAAQTLQANASGKAQTLGETIASGDQSFSPVLGSITTTAQAKTTAQPTVAQATSEQLQDPMMSAFQNLLGRDPSGNELTQFKTFYDNMQQSASKADEQSGDELSGVTDQSGVQELPGMPTESQAAEDFAMQNDQTSYQGHKFATAFGMLMNMVDRQGTSALDTVGASPNRTS